VLFGKLAHVEAQIGALIAENQLGQRLGEFGLAHAGGAGEEQHAARAAGAGARLGAGHAHHRALENVQRLGDGAMLPLDAIFDEALALADLGAQVILAPGVVERADLIAAHRVVDGTEPELLTIGKLGDVGERREAHAFGAFGEALEELGARGLRGLRVAREQGGKLAGGGGAGFVIRAGDDQARHTLAVQREPRGQILRPIHQPQHRVEEQGAAFFSGQGGSMQRELFSGDEEAVLGFGEVVDLARKARGKVDEQRAARLALADQILHQVAQRFQADQLAAIGELEVEKALGQLARLGFIGINAQAVDGVEDQQAAKALCLEGLPQSTGERHQRGARTDRLQKAVADVAGDHELRADRQQTAEVCQPARGEGRHANGGHRRMSVAD
jgi:hypothetical protein